MAARRQLVGCLVVVAAACGGAAEPEPAPLPIPATAVGRVERMRVPGPSLAGNLLGDSADRPTLVYLPPTYDASPERRYPVVYLLHGFGDTPDMWENGRFQGLKVSVALDSLAKAGAAREMIVVMPNARNAYAGSFYVNSSATGRWEDFIAGDLVQWTDRTYRTRARRESRGLVGLSMGGFGALNLAFRRSDTFGAVYALSPCCLDFSSDTSQAGAYRAIATARDRGALYRLGFFPLALVAIGAAASPNPAKPPFFADFPLTLAGNSFALDSSTFLRWREATPLGGLPSRLRGARRLAAIGVEAGDADDFKDIPILAPRLAAALTAAGIPATYSGFSGGHTDHFRERFVRHAVPFISGALR